jgi:hypothetical protein
VAVDACRYYGALIVAAINGESKVNILSAQFYPAQQHWFDSQPLHQDILYVAQGSFKKPGGYKDGIRGKGHIVSALEAALWAFWSTDSFEKGALDAVNLGDDTDTTAAIYGQLAGAYYGYGNIPKKWRAQLYANQLIMCMAEWLQFLSPSESKAPEGQRLIVNGSRFSSPFDQSHHIDLTQSRPSKSDVNGGAKQHSRRKRAKSAERPRRKENIFRRCFLSSEV